MIGNSFAHYRIPEKLGAGGMGEVYLAEDPKLSRKVALKFVLETEEDGEERRKRFLREARAAAALDHPFICKIYDTGESEGRAFNCDGVRRGGDARTATKRWSPAARRGSGQDERNGRSPGRGSRARHRAPRLEASQRDAHDGRPHQDHGLRTRKAARARVIRGQ